MVNVISPAIQLPIRSEAVTIDISPASRFGQPFDVARFTTVTVLAQPLSTPQRFLIPRTDAFSDPKLTLPDGLTLQFTPDAIDAGALEQLKNRLLQQVQQFLANVTEDTARQAQQTIAAILQLELCTTAEEVPAGTQLIKFSYTKPVRPQNGVYVLDSLVPLASFTLQNGGRIHLTVAMPFDPPVPVDKVEGRWVTTQGQERILTEQNLENRTILTAFWQQDPQLTIRYTY